ncbi:MAG: dihydroorotate dehydrogenase electron transfer subunit [Defluviitaleaceae bacterium]|nr:dihydroorotate dehydrogenase electron transfer subunit [Defluviitaleaceae bacterium]MCL2835487.1 dihydroorotate dehydrogenase electron transfer subunit [Defluviitaleaceae bacterium]
MINSNNALILKNEQVARDIYVIELHIPNITFICRAGQFVNLYTGNNAMLLPRPISICRADKNRGVIKLVYRIAGKGTEIISRMKPDSLIRVMGPLGNGFKLEHGKVALVGGGVGIPPLLELAHALRENDDETDINVFIGYRNNETFLLNEFREICRHVDIATDDGSAGFHGNSVDLFKNGDTTQADFVYACGPLPMLKSLSEYMRNRADRLFLSLEERMGCGTGACMGCAVKVRDGANWVYKRVCRDGPVFTASDLLFDIEGA